MQDKVIVLRGRVDWAKLTGAPRPYTGNPKYNKGPYWNVDITPDEKGRKMLEELGVSSKLRSPGENDHRKETFLSLRYLATKSDGSPNDPPRIVDAQGNPWSNGLIGNGSVADIKIKVKDYGKGSEKGTYFQAARILEHVPYVSNEFAPLATDDEFFSAADDQAAPVAEAGEDDDIAY